MFAIVENQQQLFRPPMARATVSVELTSDPSLQPKHARLSPMARGADRISEASSTSQAAIGKAAEDAVRDLQCKRGLSDAARSGQGHDAVCGKEIP